MKPSPPTASEIEAAFAEGTPTRKRWKIVLFGSVITMALLGLAFGSGERSLLPFLWTYGPPDKWLRSSGMTLLFFASMLSLFVLALVAGRGIRSGNHIADESPFRGVGECGSFANRSVVRLLEDGWRFDESPFRWSLSLALLTVSLFLLSVLMLSISLHVPLIMFAPQTLLFALGLRLPRALPYSTMRRVTRHGTQISVIHDADRIPVPFVVQANKSQWARIAAALPSSIEVEDLTPIATTADPTARRAYVPPLPPPRTAIDARKLKELDATLESLTKDLAAGDARKGA